MKHTNEKRSFSIFEMVGFSLIAAAILGSAFGALFNGNLHYSNWWKGAVFAPFALVVVFLLVVLLIRGKPLEEKRRRR